MFDENNGRYRDIVKCDPNAEYRFNRREGGNSDQLDGVVWTNSGADNQELCEQLVTKTPINQVRTFGQSGVKTDIAPETVVINETVDVSFNAVETFIGRVLSQREAVLQSAARNGYSVYSKERRTEVNYKLTKTKQEQVSVRVQIVGYPPASSFLAEFFEAELTGYAANQAPD